MGDLNLDMSKNAPFNIGIYACAAAGAVTGVVTYGTGTLLSTLAVGAAGAIAGGIGIPVALTAVAVVGYAAYVGVAAAVKALKKEGAVVPLGMAVVGFSAAKALFVSPFTATAGLGKKLFAGKPDTSAKPDAPAASHSTEATPSGVSAFFSKMKLKPLFEKALKPRITKKSKPAPKPKNAPPPPTA